MQSLLSWSQRLLQGLVQMPTNQHSGARVVKLHLKSGNRLADQEEKVPFLVRYGWEAFPFLCLEQLEIYQEI
ncbi:hypothetical protein NDU88_003048 [Pleurodeles waltl]|uniref:Uncharacterized protein n=1 Tax=Pleurodeles waltl TaxID=8319 RepID=A0AAV7UYZ0_PLEWA|nr:hypothetical protein NDU88_003048 [Pleurodeles waltl]